MFLSLVPRRPEPFTFRIVDDMEDDSDFFTDLVEDIVAPLTFYSPRTARWAQKKNHQRLRLKKRMNSETDGDSSLATPPAKKGRFEVQMDVEGFSPDEIKVKLADNWLTVEGSHESKDMDGGVVSRSFMRKCTIPEDVNLDEMTCNLNSTKGHMLISAPRKALQPKIQEKVIPIILQEKADTTDKALNESAEKPETEMETTLTVNGEKKGGLMTEAQAA